MAVTAISSVLGTIYLPPTVGVRRSGGVQPSALSLLTGLPPETLQTNPQPAPRPLSAAASLFSDNLVRSLLAQQVATQPAPEPLPANIAAQTLVDGFPGAEDSDIPAVDLLTPELETPLPLPGASPDADAALAPLPVEPPVSGLVQPDQTPVPAGLEAEPPPALAAAPLAVPQETPALPPAAVPETIAQPIAAEAAAPPLASALAVNAPQAPEAPPVAAAATEAVELPQTTADTLPTSPDATAIQPQRPTQPELPVEPSVVETATAPTPQAAEAETAAAPEPAVAQPTLTVPQTPAEPLVEAPESAQLARPQPARAELAPPAPEPAPLAPQAARPDVNAPVPPEVSPAPVRAEPTAPDAIERPVVDEPPRPAPTPPAPQPDRPAFDLRPVDRPVVPEPALPIPQRPERPADTLAAQPQERLPPSPLPVEAQARPQPRPAEELAVRARPPEPAPRPEVTPPERPLTRAQIEQAAQPGRAEAFGDPAAIGTRPVAAPVTTQVEPTTARTAPIVVTAASLQPSLIEAQAAALDFVERTNVPVQAALYADIALRSAPYPAAISPVAAVQAVPRIGWDFRV